MKTTNNSDHHGPTLRKIFTAVRLQVLEDRPSWQPQWKAYRHSFRVNYANRRRDSHCSGHAYIGCRPVWRLGYGTKAIPVANVHFSVPKRISVAQLAAVMRHELYHAFGVRDHGDYPPGIRVCKPEPFAGLAAKLGLPEYLEVPCA